MMEIPDFVNGFPTIFLDDGLPLPVIPALEFTRQQAIERTAQYPHGILDLLFDQKSSSSNSSVWARSATISFTVAPRTYTWATTRHLSFPNCT